MWGGCAQSQVLICLSTHVADSRRPPPPPTLLRQGLFVVHRYVCQARWPVSFEDSPVSHLAGRSPGVADMLHHIEPYWGFKLRSSLLRKGSTHVVIFTALMCCLSLL